MDAASLQALQIEAPGVLKGHGRDGEGVRPGPGQKAVQVIVGRWRNAGLCPTPRKGRGTLTREWGEDGWRAGAEGADHWLAVTPMDFKAPASAGLGMQSQDALPNRTKQPSSWVMNLPEKEHRACSQPGGRKSAALTAPPL